jgi:hypothetical protein
VRKSRYAVGQLEAAGTVRGQRGREEIAETMVKRKLEEKNGPGDAELDKKRHRCVI